MRMLNGMMVAIVVLLATALTAQAGVSVSVNALSDPDIPAGYKSYDLVVTTVGQFRGAQMLSNLTSGSFFQDTDFGGDRPQAPGIYTLSPVTAFDTFVTTPDDYPILSTGDGSNSDDTSIAGGAVDIVGGGLSKTFSTDKLDIAWFDTVDTGPGAFVIARLTVSDSTNGDLAVLANETTGGVLTQFDFTITNGVITPEPATLSLLGMGGLALLRRRRRKA